MACCIFAAFLLAQAALLLKRWGRFWCVLRRDDVYDEPNVVDMLKVWLKKPAVRVAAVFFLSGEAVALGFLITQDHGDHLFGLAQQFFNKGGEDQIIYTTDGGAFIYTTLCTSDGETKQLLTSLR